jgi:hemoglobin
MPNDPQTTDPTPYVLIGGETAVRNLVDRFHDLMDEDQDFYSIRKLHAASLSGAREKLIMFLSGWLGGPPLYLEAFGHPRLRARQMPFFIGIFERDQWIACMVRATEEAGVDVQMKHRLAQAFFQTADFMRNQPNQRDE